MATDRKMIGAAMIAFAAALWGVDGVVLRPRLYHLDVPVVVFLEHALAFLFMAVFFIQEWRALTRLKIAEWMAFFWIAVFGGAVGTMAVTKALFYVNFQQLSVIILLQKLQPVFAIAFALMLLKERPKRGFYAWTLAALLGSYLLTFGFEAPVFAGNRLFVAAMLSLLAAFSWGSCTAVGKKALNSVNFRVATYMRFGLTSAFMLVIVATTNSSFAGITFADIGILLLICFTTGGVAILIYYYGLSRVKATTSSILELSFPLTTVFLDYLVNGTVLSAGQYIGAAIIVLAMPMVTRLK